METENIVKVVPTKQQLLTTKGRVSCSEDGCTKSFAHSGAMRMHTVKSHGLIRNESDKCLFHKRKASDATVFRFHCPVALCWYGEGAKKFFNSYSLVKQHYLKVHAERRFPCSRCETAFIRECDLKQHQQRCGVLYRCGTCTVSYTTKEALLTHCKRQHHVYPEEYMRQLKNKAEKKQNGNKKPSLTQPVITIITQPMLLVPVQTKEPVKPSRHIQPKPVSEQSEGSKARSGVVCKQDKVNVSSAVRQDALIQTDIYGIDTLALNKNVAPAHRTLYSKNTSHLNEGVIHVHNSSQQISSSVSVHPGSHNDFEGEYSLLSQKKSPPKKQTLVKRRYSLQRDMNPASPRRKKMKSSTGIQTSVSLTRKKGIPIVSSTQTTGDYIIETALRHANIHIEKKTVASQVTPQKPCKFDPHLGQFGKPKAVLVDSFSQVKQQNIRAETSHNLAESQTMTDLPPSISTQTLQSYLVNLQERHSKNQSNLSTDYSPNRLPLNSNQSDISQNNIVDAVVLPKAVNKQDGNTVKIYGENLDTSVNYVMPHEPRQKQKPVTDVEELTQRNDSSPMYTAVALDGAHVGIPLHNKNIKETVGAVQNTDIQSNASNSDGDIAVDRSHAVCSTSTFEENYLTQQGHMTDMEAQTMSASEFDALLQSSGIFMNNTNFMFDTNKNQNTTTSTQETGTEAGELASELDFLGTNTDTIDMNTQTVDFSLFESFVPIDSNTQTGGEGIDFLDMVMTNMETQTLNDDDLAGLGLLDGSLTTSSMQTLANGTVVDINRSVYEGNHVGISVGTGDSVLYKTLGCENVKNNSLSQNSTVTTSTSPCFFEENFMNKDNTNNQSIVHNQAPKNALHSNSNLLGEPEGKVKVQTETQTVSQDTIEPLLQTEMQTQVESADTDFETINTETQTTFEDLQQLCDWLQ